MDEKNFIAELIFGKPYEVTSYDGTTTGGTKCYHLHCARKYSQTAKVRFNEPFAPEGTIEKHLRIDYNDRPNHNGSFLLRVSYEKEAITRTPRVIFVGSGEQTENLTNNFAQGRHDDLLYSAARKGQDGSISWDSVLNMQASADLIYDELIAYLNEHEI